MFSVASQEKLIAIREEMESLFRSYTMTLKHVISDGTHDEKVVKRIEEVK